MSPGSAVTPDTVGVTVRATPWGANGACVQGSASLPQRYPNTNSSHSNYARSPQLQVCSTAMMAGLSAVMPYTIWRCEPYSGRAQVPKRLARLWHMRQGSARIVSPLEPVGSLDTSSFF